MWWRFLPLVENKIVGADSISARSVAHRCTIFFSGAQRREPPHLLFFIYYLLFVSMRFPTMKTFSNKVLTKPEAEQALDTAIALVRRNLPLYTDHCQNHSSVHDIYPQCENNQ